MRKKPSERLTLPVGMSRSKLPMPDRRSASASMASLRRKASSACLRWVISVCTDKKTGPKAGCSKVEMLVWHQNGVPSRPDVGDLTLPMAGSSRAGDDVLDLRSRDGDAGISEVPDVRPDELARLDAEHLLGLRIGVDDGLVVGPGQQDAFGHLRRDLPMKPQFLLDLPALPRRRGRAPSSGACRRY